MLKILKASAGSGKTYNLAREYIRLIVRSDIPDAYSHVLAVTFTNKATGEMKRRILKELHTLSTAPESSRYIKDLVPSGSAEDISALQKRASRQLSLILHDYSAFAVSTIDRFFQQALRAFSREIGQFASYQVQVDRDALLSESADRVLDDLGEDDTILLDWLTRSARENLGEKGRIGLEDVLLKMARGLSSIGDGEVRYDKETVGRLGKVCSEIIDEFPRRVADAVQKVLDAMGSVGLAPEDFFKGYMTAIRKNLEGAARPSDAFISRSRDPEQWFSKANVHLLPAARSAVKEPLDSFLNLYGQPYREYVTAGILKSQIYSLGVAGELKEALVQIQKEKNILSLDDSASILRGIIGGTDTPFIYEKMGVRYANFLLDEFQDTSLLQWDNFRPLVHSGVDSGEDSLVVGDVKQSIYRWRGSDWDLLGSSLEREFREPVTQVLEGNWRTCREIVEFNNAFFTFASRSLDEYLGGDEISTLYADVVQTPCALAGVPGSVEAVFTRDQMPEILKTVDDLRERGAAWKDIAILVRGNDEGARVAQELVMRGYPVVSDDSLYVKSSVIVRRLVSQLSLCDSVSSEGKNDVAGYMARSMQVELPEGYHSLMELAESLLRDIRSAYPELFEDEIPYIQSFMDFLKDWTAAGGNNLGAFLRSWEESSPKISSPDSGNSVRVMTVHKAKGLEFPFVIVPFAQSVSLYKAPTRWARPKLEGTRLEGFAGELFQVQLDSSAAESFFADEYEKEVRRQAVDALNVFYVALTRAKYGLKIISAPPPDKLLSALKKGLAPQWKNLSQLLYAYVGCEEFREGELYDFHNEKKEETEQEEIVAGYPSYAEGGGSRLRFSPEAADFFGEGGLHGPEASTRIRGNVLHDILAGVVVPGDLPRAVAGAVSGGNLPAYLEKETLDFLSGRIESVSGREWFSPQSQVKAESPILSPDGREYRPDRVVIKPDGSVDVIDYKFGREEEGYKYQVKRYVKLYRGMGYEKVNGYLWYLEDNLIIFVS